MSARLVTSCRLGRGLGQAGLSCHWVLHVVQRWSLGLMVGEKKAISRGGFRYNGPCGCQDGHCAVRKSVIYIYSIYIHAPPSNRPLEHLFVVQPSYARPTHAHVRIGVWYHPHGACRGFWLSIFGTRLFWPSLQCAPKPMKLVHRCIRCDAWSIITPSRTCLLYTSPSPRDQRGSRMPSSA